MIKEIYFRDPTDPKYKTDKLETSEDIEALISKIRMILFTSRGEVLGEPELGMDLEDFMFDFHFSEGTIRNRFYSQIGKYIPENKYLIDLDIDVETDGVQYIVNLYVKINNNLIMGVVLS